MCCFKGDECKEHFGKTFIIKTHCVIAFPSVPCRQTFNYLESLAGRDNLFSELSGLAVLLWSIISVCVCVSLLNCWHVVTQLVI